MKVSVFNTHSSAVGAAGIVFAPRREVEVDLDEDQLKTIRENRYLGLAYDGTHRQLLDIELEVFGDKEEYSSPEEVPTGPDAASESDQEPLTDLEEQEVPAERVSCDRCLYMGTPQQVRAHRLSHRGEG